MSHQILHRLTAILSVFLLLAVESSHLLCAPHIAHADEWNNVSPVHEHQLCECELCFCPAREMSVAVNERPIDDQTVLPVAITSVRQEATLSFRATVSQQLIAPPDNTLSAHLRFRKVTVILV